MADFNCVEDHNIAFIDSGKVFARVQGKSVQIGTFQDMKVFDLKGALCAAFSMPRRP